MPVSFFMPDFLDFVASCPKFPPRAPPPPCAFPFLSGRISAVLFKVGNLVSDDGLLAGMGHLVAGLSDVEATNSGNPDG
jgi:hypothetical protein